MKYCKLIEPISVPTNISIFRSIDDKRGKYEQVRLEPGKVYEVPEDKKYLHSLAIAKKKQKYSEQLETLLKSHGIEYKIVYCKACGGKRKEIEYPIVEVFDE